MEWTWSASDVKYNRMYVRWTYHRSTPTDSVRSLRNYSVVFWYNFFCCCCCSSIYLSGCVLWLLRLHITQKTAQSKIGLKSRRSAHSSLKCGLLITWKCAFINRLISIQVANRNVQAADVSEIVVLFMQNRNKPLQIEELLRQLRAALVCCCFLRMKSISAIRCKAVQIELSDCQII